MNMNAVDEFDRKAKAGEFGVEFSLVYDKPVFYIHEHKWDDGVGFLGRFKKCIICGLQLC